MYSVDDFYLSQQYSDRKRRFNDRSSFSRYSCASQRGELGPNNEGKQESSAIPVVTFAPEQTCSLVLPFQQSEIQAQCRSKMQSTLQLAEARSSEGIAGCSGSGSSAATTDECSAGL